MAIRTLLDERRPRADGRRHADRIQFVPDRPGHDHRYAIDAAKAKRALGWKPQESLQTGLSKTVEWYLDHMDWTMDDLNSEDRLGLNPSIKRSPRE
jgi:dTDP-glucose 4,6-dehydratase